MVDFFGMDLAALSSVANIFSGLATLILAYLTWLTITQSRKDYAVTRKQLLLAQRENDPKLSVVSKSFSGDTISLRIINKGKRDAQNIALITSFSTAKLDIREWRTDSTGKKVPYGIHIPSFKKIRLKRNEKIAEYVPEHCANYISKGKNEPIILSPNNSIYISVDPRFLFQNANKTESITQTFSELKKSLVENEISAVGINISLEYKNNLEDIIDTIHIANFIFDSREHTSLQEAVKDGLGYELRCLGLEQIETELGWVSYSIYKGKTGCNYFEEEKELEHKL
ncbi:MAG: hypothetical protein WC483_01490 [Candidatus Paceibacterota bacterium]